MPIFYTNTGSLDVLQVSSSALFSSSVNNAGAVQIIGTGSSLLSVTGSTGPLLEVSDLDPTDNSILALSSGSVDILLIDALKNVRISGSLIVTGSIIGVASINVSADTVSNNVSQLVFSNSNNINFGLSSNTITAQYNAPVQSYFEHIPAVFATNTSNFGTAAIIVQPFVLPYDVSISFIRVPINYSFQSSNFATTANTSIQYRQTQTYYANIYTLGAGGNSKSLQQIAGSNVSFVYAASATQGASSTNQTNNFAFTWYTEGQTTSQNATNITVAQSSVFNFTTNVLTVASGIRYIDIPFATSLPRGDYWIAFQRRSSFASTGLAAISNVSLNNQFAFATQPNISAFGQPTNTSTTPYQPGVGTHSAVGYTQGQTTDSIAFSQISTVASQPRVPFQFIRYA